MQVVAFQVVVRTGLTVFTSVQVHFLNSGGYSSRENLC